MNYRNKYNYQKKHIEKLIEENECLKQEIADLKNENNFLKTYNTSSGKEAKKLISEIEYLKHTYSELISQTEEIKNKYLEATKEIKILNKNYKKRIKDFFRQIRK